MKSQPSSPSRSPMKRAQEVTPSGTGVGFKSYLLLHHVGKKTNFGQLLRSALAFGVEEVGVVGAKKIADLQLFGNQGTKCHADFRFFETLQDAKKYFSEEKMADIVGVEIGSDSRCIFQKNASKKNVFEHPFKRSTCFILGNEGSGMSEQQMAICDWFTYIPQYSKKTASLNVLVAGSIILHHFAIWAEFEEAPMVDAKFDVEVPRSAEERYKNPTEAEKEEIEKKRAERALKKQKVAE